jgi:hypothetical protein
MTQIDEKALETALDVLFDNGDEDTWRDRLRKVLTAYLSALPPPAGEVGELVAKLRQTSFFMRNAKNADDDAELLDEAADALTALSARVAEAERTNNEFFLRLEEKQAMLNEATARAERAEAALREIKSQAEQPQISYEKIGPTWTSRKTGEEYESTSTHLDFAAEIVALCDAALSPALAGGEDGWVLVPREPTQAMADAAQAVPSWFHGMPAHWSNIWDAMISASPAKGARDE